ncbi:MAG: MotA/TolQ/ExbB proton channel family protein [Pirellulales bacterium]|nr:MotA/TolQ/ExbB proton channel family protein [Pirellulales bacterium]
MSPARRNLARLVLLAFLVALVAAILATRALGDPAGAAPGAATAPVAEDEPIPTQNLWDIIESGGVLMIPIAFCSLLLVAFVFERFISLRHGRIIPKPFVRRFLEQMRAGELDRDQALALCEESGSPVSQVFAGAVQKWGRPAVEVEQAIIDAGERVTNGLRRYLRVLNGVATISPLLGLLGTVFGMIRAFNAIATTSAMGRPELLATGISEALLTTAAGLCVAIPALSFYLLFVSRVDRLIIDIDALSQELVPMISAEDMENRAKRSTAAKSRRSA